MHNKQLDRSSHLAHLVCLAQVSNHPYLIDGIEDRQLDSKGEHLVENCGKASHDKFCIMCDCRNAGVSILNKGS